MKNTIKHIASSLSDNKNFEVRYVKNETIEYKQAIKNCYNNILWADLILAVRKKDKTLGNGTLYEIAFAELNKKKIHVL